MTFINLSQECDVSLKFEKMCIGVLSGNHKSDVNYTLFTHVLSNLIKQDVNKIYAVVYKLLVRRITLLRHSLTAAYKNNTLTINMFKQRYNRFFSRASCLMSLLDKLNTSSHTDTWMFSYINNQYSFTNGMHNMLIAWLYHQKYDDKENIFALLEHLLKEDATKEDVLSIYNMYQMYKLEEEQVKNEELIIFNFTMSEEMIEDVVSDIDKLIRLPLSDKITNLVSIMVNLNTEDQTELFYKSYVTSFQKRFHNKTFIESNERFVFKMFKSVQGNTTALCINNLLRSHQEDETINTAVNSRLKNIAKHSINNDRTNNCPTVTVNTCPDYDNEDTIWTGVNSIRLPDNTTEFSMRNCYSSVSKLYQKLYPNRAFSFIHKDDTLILSVTLNKTDHMLKLNVLQASILFFFNKYDQISATDIAKELEVELCDIAPALNSFLKSDLVRRDGKIDSDPDQMFFLNKDYTNKHANLSLLNLCES